MTLFNHIVPPSPDAKFIVVADVHGQDTLLQALLGACNYREGEDVLLFLGDLIDRGPGSLECLRYLSKQNVYSCLGNHESMALSALSNNSNAAEAQWLMNGGSWITGTDEKQKQEVVMLIQRMAYTISFNWHGLLIGLVHADFPSNLNWQSLGNSASAPSESDLYNMLWSRKRVTASTTQPVPDLDYLIVGHTVVEQITWKSNVIHLDTGAALFGRASSKKPRLTAAVFGKRQYFVSIDENAKIFTPSSRTIGRG